MQTGMEVITIVKDDDPDVMTKGDGTGFLQLIKVKTCEVKKRFPSRVLDKMRQCVLFVFICYL